METSALLLIASLGAITVLLMLYVYIFTFDRRLFLVLWFTGWSVIALNYSLDAFFPYLLRQNQHVFMLSLSSYFCANLLISWGVLLFLKIKVRTVQIFGIGMIWLIFFVVFSMLNLPALYMIHYTSLSVFALSSMAGIVMIRSAKKYGRLIFVLGLLYMAWVCNNLIFSYILKMPHMAPYVISHIILLLNAIGLIQLYFKEQKDAIQEGLEHITYLTFHDGLTGLYNKTYFDDKLKEMENSKEYLPISLIIGDMNGLKFVNDVFGHHEGDNWLRKIALIFQQSCRHHKWWNGGGYPQGLKGEEIPLMSRIISILNAFDDMTHRQQDKPAMTAEEALLELQHKAGSQFDPYLVRLFIKMMNENRGDAIG